jgi:ankyrin repeat protein
MGEILEEEDGDREEVEVESWERTIMDEDKPKYAWEAAADAFAGRVDVAALHRSTSSPQDVALWEAAGEGNAAAVETFLLQGARANHRAGASMTLPVLHLAAALGHDDVINVLLRHGALVDARDGEGWTALHMAADRGHVAAVRRLHAAGADVNARIVDVEGSFSEGAEAALHWCAVAEDDLSALAMVDCLCDLGADVDLRSSVNRTALHWAVDHNNVAIARRLLERGADPDARTGFHGDLWWTPLTWASRMGEMPMVEMLLEKGANVFVRCQDQRTALWWAEQNCHEDIADVLRKYGVVDRAPVPTIYFDDDVEGLPSP